jgi:hypothetical protein
LDYEFRSALKVPTWAKKGELLRGEQYGSKYGIVCGQQPRVGGESSPSTALCDPKRAAKLASAGFSLNARSTL